VPHPGLEPGGAQFRRPSRWSTAWGVGWYGDREHSLKRNEITVLAVTLTAGWQAAFFGVATLLFLIAAFLPVAVAEKRTLVSVNVVALGLALATFIFFWQALALS
jgi:hypothetical protein